MTRGLRTEHRVSKKTYAYLCVSAAAICLFLGGNCKPSGTGVTPPNVETPATSNGPGPSRVDNRPPPLARPIPFWEHGKVARQVDAATASGNGFLVLDIGESWTPYIFTERERADEAPVPNAYRNVYLALARGEFPTDMHGQRANEDKYLELYGIMPTFMALKRRFADARARDCSKINLEPIENFQGFIGYRGNDVASRDMKNFQYLEALATKWAKQQNVASPAEVNSDAFKDREKVALRDYLKKAPEVAVIRTAQDRLQCEGYFVGRGKYIRGALDWATHEAIAEFERKHRVYGWGYIGRETLDVLKKPAVELERLAVVRVLTERAMHAAGVLEDGSVSTDGQGKPRMYKGRDGEMHPIPNLEADIEARVVDAFGLQTPDTAWTWLSSIGTLGKTEEVLVALRAPKIPEYYSSDMDLSASIDRGDVWYDFPFDDQGKDIPQPVGRRPRITLFVKYLGQTIPLAKYGTTIGGWRSEFINGQVLWKYKESPPGPVIWSEIVASPVWVPPDGIPPKDLLERNPNKHRDGIPYQIKYHEMGPSYASAYGLVAAYHSKPVQSAGRMLYFDEGIRTHGSVDYMSIMRRHSHGCHRMHNHIAVRLMSFILEHRAHTRKGQDHLNYERLLEYEDKTYTLKLQNGGYVFKLDKPIVVDVLAGRIQGARRTPITTAVPKFDPVIGAYMHPDAGAVLLRNGQLVPTQIPQQPTATSYPADAGVGATQSQ